MMLYSLHGVPILFETLDARIRARLERQWRPFSGPGTLPPLRFTLSAVAEPPPIPSLPPVSSGLTVTYFREDRHLVAHFHRWGRYDIDLEAGTGVGVMTEACLSAYGVFEDMIVVALAPLLRRRRLYTIHAFAAAIGGKAILLIGDVAAGKTTTGLSLLVYGARLIANDSPLLRLRPDGSLDLCAYPGLLSTYPAQIAWFPALSGVLAGGEQLHGSEKLSFAVDDIWPERWQMTAPPDLLLFPGVVPGLAASAIRPLPKFEALQRLVSQSIEDWDAATIPAHLRVLRLLVDSAPAYELDLAPDVDRIPHLITDALNH